MAHDLGQARVVGGRGRQINEVDAGLDRRQAQLALFFRRQVDDDQAVDPSFLGIGQETVDPVDVNGIVVAHEDDRRVVVPLAERAHDIQGFRQGHAGLQRAQAGGLDRRAVSHGVGERHADLDQVGPCRRDLQNDLLRQFRRRVAGGQEGHQTGATFGLQFGEFAGNAGLGPGLRGHRFSPFPDSRRRRRRPCRRARTCS